MLPLELAAVVHGELLNLRPFAGPSGVVARAAARLVLISTGFDPRGLVAVDVGHREREPEYVGAAGAFAFLAAGYKTPEAVAGEIAELRPAGRPFGVNVFVPTPVPVTEADFRRYATRIAAEGTPYGLDLAAAARTEDDDHWAAKLDRQRGEPVPVVSFTFGLPPAPVVRDLRRAERADAGPVPAA
ncbi:hypothetical protein GCM10027452_28090 [Micromonospora halotolerans]